MTRADAKRGRALPAPDRAWVKKLLPKLGLSVVLALLFMWLYRRTGIRLLPSKDALSQVSWWAIPVYVVFLGATNYFRASRWRFLAAPIKHVSMRDTIALNWIGFLAIFALPLRLGEMARPTLGKIKCQIPLSAGLGTVAVERVVDGIITSCCVAWAVFALPHRVPDDPIARSVPYYGSLALAVFCCAFLALGLFLWKRDIAAKMVAITFGLLSPTLGTKLAQKVDSVADGLRSLTNPRLVGGFLLESCIYWGLNAIGMWVFARGCGLDMTLGQAFAVMGVLAIGILLPAGPGLFGAFQLAMNAGLLLYFDKAIVNGQGVVYVFLLYVVQAAFIGIGGLVPLYAMNLRMSDVLAGPPEGQSTRPPPPGPWDQSGS